MNYKMCTCAGYAVKKDKCLNLVKPFVWLCSVCWNMFEADHK